MGNTNFQTIHQMGTAISDMLKQATGRDDVQNIDMEHVTVAQNHRYEEIDLSGQVVSFQAGEAGLPFEKLNVQIKPVQDLHGYDKPWPAGGGKNLLNLVESEMISTGWNRVFPISIKEGTYIISCQNQFGASSAPGARVALADENNVVIKYLTSNYNFGNTEYSGSSTAITEEEANRIKRISFQLRSGGTKYADIVQGNLQLEIGSTAATAYAPYSNICPITGWTMVNVYQAGQNMEDARVYRFTFPSEAGIVYGGTLDVISGDLVVDRAMKAASAATNWKNFTALNDGSGYYIYSAGFFPVQDSRNISNVYTRKNVSAWENLSFGECVMSTSAVLTVPPEANTLELAKEYIFNTINAYFVYTLSTPLSFHLSPQQITTLLGQNYIWADTGDIEVKFTNVKGMY